jgi:flagellin
MPVIINTNSAATAAASNLGMTNVNLQKSLSRLSSGNRIVNPADDAGGLGVSMKLSAIVRRTDAASTNVANAQSFLQTQDGGLQTAGDILSRVAELKTLSTDVTKSTTDKDNYNSEFTALQAELTNLAGSKFNGISLYGGGSLSVGVSEDGSQTQAITQADLATNVTAITGAASLTALGVAAIDTAITNVAASRATNGAQSSTLQYAGNMLSVNKTNLEAANSRIADVDVASESTKLARFNILQQAGTAMLAQANQSTQSIMRLLQ